MFAHPIVSTLSHDFSCVDMFFVVYCLVDEWLHRRFGSSDQPPKRCGPCQDEFADSEMLTVMLVGKLCQVHCERAWLRQVRVNQLLLFLPIRRHLLLLTGTSNARTAASLMCY